MAVLLLNSFVVFPFVAVASVCKINGEAKYVRSKICTKKNMYEEKNMFCA